MDLFLTLNPSTGVEIALIPAGGALVVLIVLIVLGILGKKKKK